MADAGARGASKRRMGKSEHNAQPGAALIAKSAVFSSEDFVGRILEEGWGLISPERTVGSARLKGWGIARAAHATLAPAVAHRSRSRGPEA
jgi:hypothetical protein